MRLSRVAGVRVDRIQRSHSQRARVVRLCHTGSRPSLAMPRMISSGIAGSGQSVSGSSRIWITCPGRTSSASLSNSQCPPLPSGSSGSSLSPAGRPTRPMPIPREESARLISGCSLMIRCPFSSSTLPSKRSTVPAV